MEALHNEQLLKIKKRNSKKIWSSDKFTPTQFLTIELNNSNKLKYNNAHKRVKITKEGIYQYISSMTYHKTRIANFSRIKKAKIAHYRRIIIDKLFPTLVSIQH